MSSQSIAAAAGMHLKIRFSPGSVNTGVLGVCLEKSYHRMPPLHIAGGIRKRCQIISVRGMIYVLGGVQYSFGSDVSASREVYRFNPAATETPWTRCADMEQFRMSFGVGAMHGKIFVFGGWNNDGYVQECEVYDPNVNVWSRIADMMELRTNHKVVALGEYFFVYGGCIDPTDHSVEDSDPDPATEDSDGTHTVDSHRAGAVIKFYPTTILIYHPVENKWARWSGVEGGEENLFTSHDLFVVNGNFHRFTNTADGIEIYDIVRKSWSTLHSIVGLWDGKALRDLPVDVRLLRGHTIMLVDELLIVCYLEKDGGAYLLRTKGFSSENEDIVLEILQSNLPFDEDSIGLFHLDI